MAEEWAQCKRRDHRPDDDCIEAGGGGVVGRPLYCSVAPVRLTVWCKSLLFNSHGYTVFDDADGRMVFRVDNYAHNWRHETVLMDCAGNVLLTIRRCPRKILKLAESWEAYEGDKDVDRRILSERSSSSPSSASERERQIRPVFKATKDLGGHSCSFSMLTAAGDEMCYRMNWSRADREYGSKIFQHQANTANTVLVAEVSRKCGSWLPAKQVIGQRCVNAEATARNGSSTSNGYDYDHKFYEIIH